MKKKFGNGFTPSLLPPIKKINSSNNWYDSVSSVYLPGV